jgi:hypothetical protein
MRCYHVTTTDGLLYGAAATSKRDAMIFVQERLHRDESTARPVKAEDVGSCGWSYGNVICYGPASISG